MKNSTVSRTSSILALSSLVFLGACHRDCDDDGWYVAGGYETRAVTIGDVQDNGSNAVVSANIVHGAGLPHPGFITVRLQDPANSGSYLEPVETDTAPDPYALALADLSGSGRPDLLVVHRQVVTDPEAATRISVHRFDPDRAGRFLAPLSLSLGNRNPSDVAAGDLDHDGRPDIAVAADGANSIIVFFQNADGTFTSGTVGIGGVPTSVAIGDLNQDTYADLVAATTGGTVSVLIQDVAHPGTFLPPQSYAVGPFPVCVKLASLTAPERLDILTANYGTTSAPTQQGLSVLLHDPAQTGAFLPATTYDTGDYLSSSLAVGDEFLLGSTGLPYIVVANQGAPGWPGTLSVFHSDPAHPGQFLPPVFYDGAYGPRCVVIGQLATQALVTADGGTFMRYETTPGTFGSPIQLRQ